MRNDSVLPFAALLTEESIRSFYSNRDDALKSSVHITIDTLAESNVSNPARYVFVSKFFNESTNLHIRIRNRKFEFLAASDSGERKDIDSVEELNNEFFNEHSQSSVVKKLRGVMSEKSSIHSIMRHIRSLKEYDVVVSRVNTIRFMDEL